jgi:hypothetical protein
MKGKWKFYVTIGVILLVLIAGWFVGTDYYGAAWLRWQLGFEAKPTVVLPEAQLANEVTETPRYWVFQVEGGQRTKVDYQAGELASILPSKAEGSVEVYSTAPFGAVSFSWEEWESLPQVVLTAERWREYHWDEGASQTMGRVPAGPPEERGVRVTWGCDGWEKEDRVAVPDYHYQLAYLVRLTVSGDVPVNELHTTFRSCLPEWNAEHPRWDVLWIRRRDACGNKGFSGWSGKMIQVWVTDEKNQPMQGVEVRFDVEPSYGTAYDRPDFGGFTSRFGLVEWNSLGVPTRYRIWMEGDEEPLVTNVRVDLGREYCQKGNWLARRPGCGPGFYSYEVRVQARGD